MQKQDYCTLFPEGWWAKCCELHDADYVAQVGQAVADSKLLQCVAASGDGYVVGAASAIVGWLMWLGVRFFGKKYYKKAKPGVSNPDDRSI